MIKILILAYFLLIGLDILNIVDLRTLVYSFLLSKRNKKSAQKIHLEQPRKNKFTLSYIDKYAVYKREFRFFQKGLVLYYYTLIPQYFLLIVVNLFSSTLALILIFLFFLLKFIIAIMIACQFSHNRVSRFDKRYKE